MADELSLREIDERVAAIQDTVTYDDLPSPAEAIERLNTAAAWTAGLRETLHAHMRQVEGSDG